LDGDIPSWGLDMTSNASLTKKKHKANNTIRLLDEQAAAYDDITRGIQLDEYDQSGTYRRFRQWEIFDRVLKLPEVKALRDRGAANRGDPRL
jgi:hypothetical protein